MSPWGEYDDPDRMVGEPDEDPFKPLPKTTIEVPVRGTKKADVDLTNVEAGLFVDLINEPDNPVDPHAVAVYDDQFFLGYIPASIAKRIDPDEWDAVIIKILEHEGNRAGLRLELRPRTPAESQDAGFF